MPERANTGHGPAERRFDALYRDHHREIVAYFVRRLARAEAEDAAAEVFAVAWRRLDEVPKGEKAVAWLYGVSYRVVANQWRTARRVRRLAGKLGGLGATSQESPEVQLVRSEEQRLLLEALDRLRLPDQEVLRLVTWERLSHGTIAELLDISEAAVGQRVSRARRRLAAELDHLEHGRTSSVAPRRRKAG